MASVLASEIASQPAEIAAFLARQTERVKALVAALPAFSYPLVVARGSSDHAGTYGRYAWGLLAGLPVAHAAPSLHTLYDRPPRLEGALVIGISQSGQSPDVVSVIEEGRKQGRPTIAITNDPKSPLAQAAEHLIDLGLSKEQSIAATKTYTGQLAAVALLAAAWSKDAAQIAALAAVPGAMEKVLAGADEPCARAAEELQRHSIVLPIARGINLCTAEETALKLRELLRLSTHAFSSADFRHGSIALVTGGLPLALIMPSGPAFEDMLALAGEVEARGATVVTISDDPRAKRPGAIHLPLAASVPEWLSPLTAILPGQLLAVDLAAALGLDPDRPRGLPEKVIRTV